MNSLASSLLARLHAHLGLKLLLLATLPVVTTAAYLLAQRKLLLPSRTLPLTWLDRAIPFQPNWVWIYLSLYLLMPIAPLLADSRDDLIKYTRGILACFAVGLICFILFPVAGPRPADVPQHRLYELLVSFDTRHNCIPSLHAACAVYAVLFAGYASRGTQRVILRRNLLAFAWIWVILILYSTIATRQHFVIDLPAGILLAVIAHWWAVQTGGIDENHSSIHPHRADRDAGIGAGRSS